MTVLAADSFAAGGVELIKNADIHELGTTGTSRFAKPSYKDL
jgi:hypothetical protein